MDTYLSILKQKGFKHTPLRQVILEIFLQKHSTLTAEQVHQMAQRKIPNAGLQSVYRNLAEFKEAGIAEEIFYGKRKTAYALCNGQDHHHHVVCSKCGRSEEIKECGFQSISKAIEHSIKKLKDKIGFKIEQHFLQLKGLCRACQK